MPSLLMQPCASCMESSVCSQLLLSGRRCGTPSVAATFGFEDRIRSRRLLPRFYSKGPNRKAQGGDAASHKRSAPFPMSESDRKLFEECLLSRRADLSTPFHVHPSRGNNTSPAYRLRRISTVPGRYCHAGSGNPGLNARVEVRKSDPWLN